MTIHEAAARPETNVESEDSELLRDAIRRSLASAWPPNMPLAELADPERIRGLWAQMAVDGQTAIGHPESGVSMCGAVVAVEEHGRAASTAPLIAALILNQALAQHKDDDGLKERLHAGRLIPAIAYGCGDGDPDAGSVTIANGRLSGAVSFVDDAAAATHLIALVDGGIAVVDASDEAVTLHSAPALGLTPFHEIQFDGAEAQFLPLANDRILELARIARLAYAARALGAARRAFELVVEHVSTRRQFGQALGQFQAVQHKLANCEVALRATEELIQRAAAFHDRGDEDWRIFAEAAVAFASPQLRMVSRETQHAFGAVGYAEAHEAPRHFRSVHSSLVRMGGASRAQRSLFDLATRREGSMFPGLWLGEQAEAFRRQLREWLEANWTAEDREAERRRPRVEQGISAEFSRRLGAEGLLSFTWPKELGGQARGPLEQLAYVEEMAAAGAPTMLSSSAAWLLAPELIRHGNARLQSEILPGIGRGEVYVGLGYSEPEAGSDLSALRTRAVRDGEEYVITGQKLWGTMTDQATHVLLAARTDPDARPKRAGISLFVVPTDLPGITIQPQMAFYGHTFSTQFYDEVRVPEWCLIGEENGGWNILTGALASERVILGGVVLRLARLLERLVRHVCATPRLASCPATTARLGELMAEVLAARLLVLRSVLTLEAGRAPVVEGAMSKVFSGELAERLTETALDIVGTVGLLGKDAEGEILDGAIEQELRTSLMLVIGGGAAEIQRTIIAQQGIGLPR